VEYKLGPNVVIGATRDGASVNGAALRQLMFFYQNLFDVVCFSHTIDNVIIIFIIIIKCRQSFSI
jgi:hypothetical protein